MELEEAIKTLNSYKKAFVFETEPPLNDYAEASKTVLYYIKEESIPRAVVEEKIEELKKACNEQERPTMLFSSRHVLECGISILQEILTKGGQVVC